MINYSLLNYSICWRLRVSISLSRFARLVYRVGYASALLKCMTIMIEVEARKVSVGSRHVIRILLNVNSQVVGKNKFSFCKWQA